MSYILILLQFVSLPNFTS